MPPKITDSRPSPEAINEMEEQTASGARRIVATYAEDFFDGVTLMSMLGVEPKGFNYKKYAEEVLGDPEDEEDSTSTKKATKKKASKKASKKKASKKKASKKKKSTKKKATKKKASKKKSTKKAKKS
ncbi:MULTISPECIES: hypothetical protein [Corynebacterium]|uniref:Histone n=1 Tax=Corynebacterium hadale TaxID=2026255 RepID=A0A269PBJ0_9CORY|nr:hypothetical protein [Corynebacterium hadale]PAJ68793.1 hypothetical protein CIG21_10105 [Corynebacterium hadale]WKC60918.1 hypothetical protein CHAD_10390 [Corynebacterium hadale]